MKLRYPLISKPWGRRTGGTATTGVPTGRDVSGRLGPDTDPDEGAAATATDDTATEASDKATTAAAGEEAETVAEETLKTEGLKRSTPHYGQDY